jgi:cyclopropane fatty-acyl-phospholipid synthase-like methyltransferase
MDFSQQMNRQSLKIKLKKLLITLRLLSPSFNSSEYWEDRYKLNGNSGAGSYNHFASFKAEFLNSFVRQHAVTTVVEFGCGDGNQLKLAQYPNYVGYDVINSSIKKCKELFAADKTKAFYISSDSSYTEADLTLSLDVIYHLVEDKVYQVYMKQLFNCSKRWVIIYSSNTDENNKTQPVHVRHRKFTDWISTYVPSFKLVSHIPNQYSLSEYGINGSFADFFVFENQG